MSFLWFLLVLLFSRPALVQTTTTAPGGAVTAVPAGGAGAASTPTPAVDCVVDPGNLECCNMSGSGDVGGQPCRTRDGVLFIMIVCPHFRKIVENGGLGIRGLEWVAAAWTLKIVMPEMRWYA